MWIRHGPVMQGEPGGNSSGGGGGGTGAPAGPGGGGLPAPGGGGPGPGTPWYSGLTSEGAELPPLVTEAPDFATFVKTAQDLKAYQGASLRIPGPEASVEDRVAFHAKLAEKVPGVYYMPDPENAEQVKTLRRKLGAPDDAAGYTFTAPEGGDLDEGLTAQYRTWVNDLDMSQEQADTIYKKFNDYQLAAINGMKGEHQGKLNELKAEYGVTYPDRIKKINFLLSRYEGTEVMQESMLKDEFPPHVVRLFSAMSDQLLGEGMQMVGTGGQAPTGVNPQEARERAAEVRAHPAFMDDHHPQHAEMVAKHLEYMKQANPQASTQHPARAGLG